MEKILEASTLRMVRTEEGKKLRKQYENKEIECGFNELREPDTRKDGCTNTITTVQKDNMVLIKQATEQGYIECNIGGVADLSYPDSKTRGRVQGKGEISPTLTASEGNICRIEKATSAITYRIRKLTPLECWRLMDFTDKDFHAAEKVNSNTQLYKEAGNSIVVNVLVAIIGQLIEGKEEAYKGKC